MSMGLNSGAQEVLPNVLSIPKDIDAVRIIMENRADELVGKVNANEYTDSEKILKAIAHNLQLEAENAPALDMQIVSSSDKGHYTIHNLIFQSMDGVYVPANLYVPKGKGPFPAVLNSHGHWPPGRRSEIVQRTSQILATNGYVCLSMDAMGSGERGRDHQHEYHGANLGSLLLDLGTPLMGVQLMENRRAIDLLCSLPYVNQKYIGATGASGGGNQTMWLAAVDPRVKAAVPVVSIGTFRSYIMNSNCVCELHPNGLLHFEEGQLLKSMAPKAIKILTALKDGNAAFNVHQMLKSFRIAKLAYQQQGMEDRIDYELFDEPHSYTTEMNISMVKWFDQAFGNGGPRTIDTIGINLLDTTQLAVLEQGVTKDKIMTIPEFVRTRFGQIENELLRQGVGSREGRQNHLRQLLSKVKTDKLLSAKSLTPIEGWNRTILETANRQLIPLLLKSPTSENGSIHVFFPSKGKRELPYPEVQEVIDRGDGVAVVDLFGLGERASKSGDLIDGALPRFHTLSRSTIWLGETMMGIWANEIEIVMGYLRQANKHRKFDVIADRETALATLLYSGLSTAPQDLLLRQLPISYLPEPKGSLDSYNMAIHIPGILQWGDIPLLLALSGDKVTLEEAQTIMGKHCTEEESSELQEKVNIYRSKFNNEGSLQIK